jgi:hypothetical protein
MNQNAKGGSMLARLRRHLTYANVMATIAVFLALGGSSYAAFRISGSQIRDRTISGKKLKPNTLGGSRIAESRLGAVGGGRGADRRGGQTAPGGGGRGAPPPHPRPRRREDRRAADDRLPDGHDRLYGRLHRADAAPGRKLQRRRR